MEQQISISESEWRVMKSVWSNPPQTLPEILDRLKGTNWSKTTIQTYLARLVKKGALSTKVRERISVLPGSNRKRLSACRKPQFFKPCV
ncbi:MAG: hypothetical protein HFI31_03670 [Lachnospiraceae bacterium]|nr:hypothetical protein [Lachnospiraceae bacterium]